MNVSYRWLREIAPSIQEAPEALAERLGMLGAPVEEMARPGSALGKIVVGRVVRSDPHPDADRLSLCQVDAGTGEPVQVVCGAPNVEVGAFYPFAPPGASLPTGDVIREATIRGQRSQGMLCSERELGLGRDHTGLLRLDDRSEPGAPVAEALGLDDAVLTLEVTPNRPDLLSHLGVARELAPEGHAGVRPPPLPAVPGRWQEGAPALDTRRDDREGSIAGVRIRLDDPEGCPRYMAAVVEGVAVGPSPGWLAGRLRAIGLRPVNNVVDATNYVLHELGQPLHAFDLDRLRGPAIVVRRARAGERIVTLDGIERKLEPGMLVIADAEAPVAVAGVMGGSESEVTAATTRVLLECADFDPRIVRRTARALGLSTDASYRYERGVDVDGMENALHRVAGLIRAVAGGAVREDALDVYPAPTEPLQVSLRPARAARVLGVELPASTIVELLEHIGFELRDEGSDRLTFAVPGFRHHDVTREIDLIEEVARRWGYDGFGEEQRPFRPTVVPEAPLTLVEDRVRGVLVAEGLLEHRGAAMAPEAAGEVPLLRPLSAEESRLRSTLVHGLLRAAERNLARGVRDIRLFEVGTTFHAAEPGRQPREETRVGVVLTGARDPRHWSGEPADFDIWDVRGLASALVESLDPSLRVEPLDGDFGPLSLSDTYALGTRLAVVGSDGLRGVAGRVEPAAVDAPAWAGPVFALELRLDAAMAQRPPAGLVPPPTRPAIDRDLALLVPDAVPAGVVAATIRDAAGPLLENLEVFDVYTGRGVRAGARSIAFRLVFRDPERTLKDEEVDRVVGRVLHRLKNDHGVERRS